MYNPNSPDSFGWRGWIPTDPQPRDYSGYGPTSGGFAPVPTDVRNQSMNRYHTNRLAEYMQEVDPYIQNAGETAMRLVGEKNKTATSADLRYQLHNTGSGQMALDAAMAMRRAGALGYGDPVNYAANVTAGVASGGFSATMFNNKVPTVGANQRVSGNGILAERVMMNYASGLMTDLYGSGTPDPEKLHGFNMEEASGVFRKIASRGGLGNAMTVINNASLSERLAAAKMSAVPTIREGLNGLDKDRLGAIESQQDPGRKSEMLESYLKELNNPKLANEVRGIVQSTDAAFVNEEGRKKVSSTVKEVIKGMASLKDIFGELQSPELHQMLESISGTRISNAGQAKRAQVMVDNLRNSAETAGMDPRAFIEMTQQMQAGFAQALAAVTGTDGRNSTELKETTARITNRDMEHAAGASAISQRAAKDAADMGIKGFAVRTADEIATDRLQQQTKATDLYAGYTTVKGMSNLGQLGKADQSKAAELMKAFENARTNEERQLIEGQLRNLAGGSEGFEAFKKSGTGQAAILNGAADPNVEATRNRISNDELNTDVLQRKLQQDLGVKSDRSADLARTLTGKLSGAGLLDMIKSSNVLSTPAERIAQIKATAATAGLDDAETKEIMSTFFDSNGVANAAAGQVAGIVATTSRGNESTYEKNKAAEEKLQKLAGESGVRKVINNEGLSLQNLAKAVLTKKITTPEDPEVLGATLDAIRKEGGSLLMNKYDKDGNLVMDENGKPVQVDVSEKYQTGIDVSQGFTKESLDRINKGAGRDVKLAQAMGMTEEQLIEATKGGKNADLMLRANNFLREQEGFNVSGNLSGLTVMSDEVAGTAKGASDKLRKLMAAQMFFPNLGQNEQNTINKSILEGKDPELGTFFQGDKTFTTAEVGNFKLPALANAQKVSEYADRVNSADASTIAGMKELDKNNAGLNALKWEKAAMISARKEGHTQYVTYDENGKEKLKEFNQLEIDKIESAISKLEQTMSSSVGQMTVTTLNVEGQFNADKKK
jgi:hypothetical protein